jgi:parallel beta-helix repeat protein
MVYTKFKKNNKVMVSPDTSNRRTIIDNIFIDNPESTKFLFKKGNYYLTKNLKIDKENINFIGSKSEDVHIFQENTDSDGFDIEASYFELKNISVHVEHDGKVALSFAGCSNTRVENCYIYGNATTFSIFYAGPEVSAGSETLTTYYRNELDSNNVFKNNVVYSKWAGDSVSFSLQKDSDFTNNIIRGGKIAIYMCRNIMIKNNTIYDSSSEGVFISLPSHDLKIYDNKIYECKSSGIKIANQLEHGSVSRSPSNIVIKRNKIYDTAFNAIELNDVDTAIISDNIFIGADSNGLYVLRSKNVKIEKNKISYFKIGIIFYDSNDNELIGNGLYSVYPFSATSFVQLGKSYHNTLINNEVKGNILGKFVDEFEGSEDNIIDNNNYEKYYSKKEEIQIMKL